MTHSTNPTKVTNIPYSVGGVSSIHLGRNVTSVILDHHSSYEIFFWGSNHSKAISSSAHELSSIETPTSSKVARDWYVNVAISTHFSILRTDGTVLTWGSNAYGEIGNGLIQNTIPTYTLTPSTPTFTGLNGKIIMISNGYNHSAALSDSGQLYLWGSNEYHQLGIANTSNQSTPQLLSSLSPVVDPIVSFQSNGGSSVADIQQAAGTDLTAPSAPTKTGYTFGGWYSDSGLSQSYTFDKMPASNTTLYAKWNTVTYNISYTLNGGTNHGSNPATYHIETATITLGNPTKTGHTFAGWYETNDFTGSAITQIALGSHGNQSLYAKWTINEYSIDFTSNGGSAVTTITQDYDTSVSAPSAPTKTGYTFGGWYSDSGLSQSYTFDKMPASNTTLYAKWNTVTYNISYTLNGGTNHGSNPATYHIETATITLGNPTKTGHTFAGWYETNDFTGSAITQIALGSHGNQSLYAKWTINTYSIRFDSSGGSAVTTIIQEYDTPVVPPNHPTKMGYTFTGWSQTLPSTMPAENLELIAQWTPTLFTITYHLNEGTQSSLNPSSYHIESATILLSNPTKMGHTFDGWFGTPGFTGNKITSIPNGSHQNITLYAKWIVNNYAISFRTHGGSLMDNVTLNYGDPFTPPAEPKREGYLFNGWCSPMPQTMPDKNLTFNAFWLKIEEEQETIDVKKDDILEAIDPELVHGKNVNLLLKTNYQIKDEMDDDVVNDQLTLLQNHLKTSRLSSFYLNIGLTLDEEGVASYDIDRLNQSVKMTIQVPEEHQGFKDYRILRIVDGQVISYDAVYDPLTQTLTFETDVLGTFIIAYEPNHGFGLWWLWLLIVLVVGYGTFRFIRYRLKNQQKKNQNTPAHQI